MKRLYAIRGAVCAENTEDSIKEYSSLLCNEIFKQNSIKTEDLVSIQFSMTKDLDVYNPCRALRHSQMLIDASQVPLFCTQEAYIKGGLEKVIRVLVEVYLEENTPRSHVYLHGAEVLRPDLKK